MKTLLENPLNRNPRVCHAGMNFAYKMFMNKLYLLFVIAISQISCKSDLCEKSLVVQVDNCTRSHSGDLCRVLTHNGKWSIMAPVEVGDSICTKEFKGM